MSETQAKPISFILPFLKDIRSLKMSGCNLTDETAALVVASVLGNSETKVLDLKGIEMGHMFVKSLKRAIKNDPECLQELSIEDIRPQTSISNLIYALKPLQTLQYFDL